MYRLIVDGVELVLPDGYKPDFSLNFAEIGKQAGSRVFPFTLPACSVNDAFFGFAHNPQSGIDRKRKFSATLLNDSIFLANGYLILKIASVRGGYTCELQMPPALVDMEVWNKSIRSLDFGSVSLPTTTYTENCYMLDVTEYMKVRYSPFLGVIYILKVNGVTQATFHGGVGGIFDRSSFDEVYAALIEEYNTETRIEAGFQLDYYGDTLVLLTPDASSYLVQLRFEKTADPRTGDIAVNETFAFTRLTYTGGYGYDSWLNNTPDNAMFCLPTIKASKFYGDSNAAFVGYLNYGFGALSRNTSKYPLQYSVSPCLFFIKTIIKLCEILGYSASGEVLNNAILKKAYFMGLVAIDRQCPGTKFPFNVWKYEVNLGSHLPDLTVKQFFSALEEQFGISVSFDVLLKVANFSFIDAKIKALSTVDYSEKIGIKNSEVEHNDAILIQVLYKNLTESETTDSYFDAVPTDANKIDGVEYIKAEYVFSPAKLLNMSDETTVGYIRKRANGGLVGTTEVEPIRYIPTTERNGVSNLFDMWRNAPATYMGFYVGLIAPDGNSMRHSVNTLGGYSLQIKGDEGFAVRNAEIIRHLQDTYILKADVALSDSEISVLEAWQRFYMMGVNFFLSSIEGKSGGVLKLKFRKC